MAFNQFDMNEALTHAINKHAGIVEDDPWGHVPDRDAVVARALRAGEHVLRKTVEIPVVQPASASEVVPVSINMPVEREHIRDRNNRIKYDMLKDGLKGR